MVGMRVIIADDIEFFLACVAFDAADLRSWEMENDRSKFNGERLRETMKCEC